MDSLDDQLATLSVSGHVPYSISFGGDKKNRKQRRYPDTGFRKCDEKVFVKRLSTPTRLGDQHLHHDSNDTVSMVVIAKKDGEMDLASRLFSFEKDAFAINPFNPFVASPFLNRQGRRKLERDARASIL